MKKLLLIAFIFIFFTCENINGINDINVEDTSQAEGLWSGSFFGDDHGTWTFSIVENGGVVGSLTSKDFNEIYFMNGSVGLDGQLYATVNKDGDNVGTFIMQLSGGQPSGIFQNDLAERTSNTDGKERTEEEARILNYWNYYSRQNYLTDGSCCDNEILYDDNRFCPNIYMEFREDGTFTDYFIADYSDPPSPDCAQPAFFGTYSVQDGYYEMLYEQGGSQDLSESDIYINFPDENTINYEYQSILWTYKLDVNQ